MRILLAFSYFPTYSEIWSPPDLPLSGKEQMADPGETIRNSLSMNGCGH